MIPIQTVLVQQLLDRLRGQDVYIHLEMTTGAYANRNDSSRMVASTFITNAKARYSLGSITGEDPYRVGLKTDDGWVYAQGLTHWEETDQERLIMAGHDSDGKLIVALQIAREKF